MLEISGSVFGAADKKFSSRKVQPAHIQIIEIVLFLPPRDQKKFPSLSEPRKLFFLWFTDLAHSLLLV